MPGYIRIRACHAVPGQVPLPVPRQVLKIESIGCWAPCCAAAGGGRGWLWLHRIGQAIPAGYRPSQLRAAPCHHRPSGQGPPLDKTVDATPSPAPPLQMAAASSPPPLLPLDPGYAFANVTRLCAAARGGAALTSHRARRDKAEYVAALNTVQRTRNPLPPVGTAGDTCVRLGGAPSPL
eukprot:SAG31_NODE_11364_length_1038_cov_3.020234_1_plen_178_part_01